jgi:hypothetical protein
LTNTVTLLIGIAATPAGIGDVRSVPIWFMQVLLALTHIDALRSNLNIPI